MSRIKSKIISFLQLRYKKFLGIDPRSQLQIAIDNGLKIGKNCEIKGEVIIDPGHCWLIEIGNDVTIAPRCHILAHDASTKRHLGYTVIGRVSIGNNVFIGANSVILPNVHIGEGSVIGAGSIVTKDVPAWSVAAGNPARVICTTDEYINKRRKQMSNRPLYDSSWTIGHINTQQKSKMIDDLKDEIGFVI